MRPTYDQQKHTAVRQMESQDGRERGNFLTISKICAYPAPHQFAMTAKNSKRLECNERIFSLHTPAL